MINPKNILAALVLMAGAAKADVLLEVYDIQGERRAECTIVDEAWPQVLNAFESWIAIRERISIRLQAYNQYALAMGFEEVPMSSSPIKTQIKIDDSVFYFGEDGSLWCDPRFMMPDEKAVKDLIERYYHIFCMQDAVMQALGVGAEAEVEQVTEDSPPPEAEVPEAETQAALSVPIVPKPTPVAETPKKPVKKRRRLPVFKGFEDPRYQQYDELIIKYTEEFNSNRAAWADATPAQAETIHDLKPALVKSHMIEESGGSGPKSKKAWAVDPAQVNVPGDWDPIKTQVGLRKPSRRNEGSAAQNVKAAIKYLVRKGFGTSGAPAKTRPGKKFDGWYHALRRYNGRNARLESGKRYKDAYAERIIKRAESPHVFVPIANDVKSARARKSKRAQ